MSNHEVPVVAMYFPDEEKLKHWCMRCGSEVNTSKEFFVTHPVWLLCPSCRPKEEFSEAPGHTD